MEPVNVEKKINLEARLGFSICPFTVETVKSVFGELGFVLTETYKCAVDLGTARGGRPSIRPLSAQNQPLHAALTPCSQEYARTCQLYQRHIHLLQIVYPKLGYKTSATEVQDSGT